MSEFVMRLRRWQGLLGTDTIGGQLLDEAAAEIARLTAQVEWHRMPTEVRRGVEWAVKESKNWADENDDEHDQTHGQRASALAAYLERTKQKEVGRE